MRGIDAGWVGELEPDDEAAAGAGAAVDLDPPAHLLDQRARLMRADPEAALLGRDEGLEQPGADEVGRHAAALVADLDHRLAARGREEYLDWCTGRAGVDRVLDQMRYRLLE